ncbi:ABC transporter substrate-binding protein [Candidatus Kapabacteria bacterium]|nr:ABC transporter substrate-binding protein [Candidatus Kapabacteria bacterium]
MEILIKAKYPERIICLTEETTETIYEIGAQDKLVGISKYTVRPAIASKEKTKVSHFTEANIKQILSLKPDIVFAWSDLQANICQQLIKEGVEVVCFNHRSISGILSMIKKLGSLIGFNDESQAYSRTLEDRVLSIYQSNINHTKKPLVYFEEWFDPLITGIEWVSELVEIAGGREAFPEYAKHSLAKNRILSSFDEVVERNPDIMIASWCGKPFRKSRVIERQNWDEISFVQNEQIYEIASADILQPGPAALTDGLDKLNMIINNWRSAN